MAGLHRKSEGKTKYLVLRRDGTMPEWDWFVMGAKDPWTYEGLLAYASAAHVGGADTQYVDDIIDMATDWLRQRIESGEVSDPDAPLHRIDNRWVLGMLARTMHVPHDVVSVNTAAFVQAGRVAGMSGRELHDFVARRFSEVVEITRNLLPDDVITCDNTFTTVGQAFIEEPLEPGQVRINADVWSHDPSTGWVNQDGKGWMASGMWPDQVPGAIVAPKEEKIAG